MLLKQRAGGLGVYVDEIVGSSRTNTLEEGAACRNNADCSLTGKKGGPAARLADLYGCCDNRCVKKIKDPLGIFWCPSKQGGLFGRRW